MFDSNHDGVLNSMDTEFAAFALWQDADQDGISDDGELTSLEDAGIVEISLISDGEMEIMSGNTIFGISEFVTIDGVRGIVGDVALSYEELLASDNLLSDLSDTAEYACPEDCTDSYRVEFSGAPVVHTWEDDNHSQAVDVVM